MSKAPIQAIADRISSVFVPIILAAAFATWLGWFVAGEMSELSPGISWRPVLPVQHAVMLGARFY